MLTRAVINSENTTDSHIPSMSKNIGNTIIMIACNKSERNTEIIAETNPLHNDVKNDEL